MRFVRPLCFALNLLSIPFSVRAQMTVAGQVLGSTGVPVLGASVGISELDINTRTGADGRYNFIIRTALIRGQTVTMVARHARFGSQSVEIQVTGGALTQNFVLAPGVFARDTTSVRSAPPTEQRGMLPSARSMLQAAAPIALEHPGAPVDLASALAGRIAGLHVIGASGAGASAPMFYRGPRSFAGNTQPLVVVDGVPIDNQAFTSVLQQFGLGGFDYGTPLQDLSLDDVASVTLMDRGLATMLYGSRAANGVIAVQTKTGIGISGLLFSATQRFSLERPTRLPAYQNQYGQGLDGAYEFFDGQGGGINDAVPESWGPRLDATPTAQHSLTEPRRPDVRYWLPSPDGVRDYFGGARTLEASIAAIGGWESSSMRAALHARDVAGLTPHSGNRRLGLTLSGASRPITRLQSQASFLIVRSTAEQRPGTGFDEISPVAGFARMGRQVDLDALRRNVTDPDGEQINWIYTDRNNPWFATERNSNEDERWHMLGGADVTYDVTGWLRGHLHVAATDASETRRGTIESGWKGGYPASLGRGDFAGGGTDVQSVSSGERSANLSLVAFPRTVTGFAIEGMAGAEFRKNEFSATSVVTDRSASGAASVSSGEHSGGGNVLAYSVQGAVSRGEAMNVSAGARLEQSSQPGSFEGSVMYPFLTARYDVARQLSAIRSLGVSNATLRASWWRAGNELSKRVLSQVFLADGTAGVSGDSLSEPERTEGLEIGLQLRTPNDRVALDLTGYRDRSTGLLLATQAGDGSVTVSRTGEVFNSGYEVSLRGTPWRGDRLGWDVGASYARNTNTVDNLGPDVGVRTMAPSLFGASQVARIGSPLGVIVGTRYLRDAGTGALILRDGLPLPDASSPLSVLGSWQPDWTGTLQSRLRYAAFELVLVVDARMGGRIFSATNLWGSYSGTLASTLIGREDSLLITGTDSVSGAANATRVSTQDYFHALGAIHEAWVYDASYTKLRQARITYELPTRFLPAFREHTLRISVIGRNLMTFARAPNIDPETALAPGVFQGFEMGQLPGIRSLGFELTISP